MHVIPDDPNFSERARAFLDAQRRGVKHVVAPDQYNFDPATHPRVPTMAELEQLKNERPILTPAPAPGGRNANHVSEHQTNLNLDREERIQFLQDSLGQEQEGFEANVDLSFKIKP